MYRNSGIFVGGGAIAGGHYIFDTAVAFLHVATKFFDMFSGSR
jgi:hypothetical protein